MVVGGCAAASVEDGAPHPARSRPGASNSGPAVSRAAVPTYVVKAHDTLYSIAWRHDLDYRELALWNHIGADYHLTIGQVLLLEPPRSAASRHSLPHAASPEVGKPVALGEHAVGERPASTAVASGTEWVWPTERSSAPRPVPGGGILLLGRLGQDVRAAGAGRVVYTGNGIRGYGNLVIIKHDDNLLSSYAHNQEVLVHEGEHVSAGEVIAHMGLGPHRVCALYFEIRVNGKPTDPLRYLSPRR
jgi:lipoprotein NlpD